MQIISLVLKHGNIAEQGNSRRSRRKVRENITVTFIFVKQAEWYTA
ncbi:MAG: hypothetical protein ACLTDV_03455 [Eubacterium sp.]